MNRDTIIYAIIFSVILCISGNTAFSQLKVKGDNGKVIIGTVPDESSQQYVEDFDNILSASIFGKGGNGASFEIKIKNIYGLVLINVPLNVLLNEKQIYLNSLSAGMYLLELISNDEVLDYKTIIKQ
ncbi:MAG TPA: hypothetical protein GX005_05740 [Bacteroidales bacterium]|nr:hypothetical protein [Bacteroidales bacterium]